MMYRDEFFAYARERYNILLRRRLSPAGGWNQAVPDSGKWTNDPILQQFRFCNVFREDDTTTKWIRERLTQEAYGASLVGAMVIARWFNRVTTLEKMLPPEGSDTPYFEHNLLYDWMDAESWTTRMRSRLEDVHPLVTGAYMIKTPGGMNKLDGLLQCLNTVLRDAVQLNTEFSKPDCTLQWATQRLSQFPFLGPFMSYEVITDLRHSILNYAPDIMTWANPGPGAARGAGRVAVDDSTRYVRSSKSGAEDIQRVMTQLLSASEDSGQWPTDWPKWEMRDIEHTLCEFDKYERVRLGEGTPKQRYQGGA